MKQSQLFTKASKEKPQEAASVNHEFLVRAGFVDQLAAGIYTFLPLGLRVLRKIEGIIRRKMIEVGGQEVLMPVLQPKRNWEQTGRWDNLDDLFKFTSYYSKTELALGPTHEEVIAPLAKRFILSYKDLPKYIFQIQTKFRDEKRAKSGILRGREFSMKDLYSFHTTEKDLDRYYEIQKKAYHEIYKECGIDNKTYLTFASGGTFSKYSHEFQTLSSAGEDTIHICDNCKVAVNEEIIKKQSVCPECGNKKLKTEKAIEVGNIFKLKTKYSEPFDLRFTDEKGEKKLVIMGCYGIGLSRLMGAIVEVSHDEEGIIWPKSVAPFNVHLISLDGTKKESDKIYNELQKSGIDVLYDDREEPAGVKFAEADLVGIPERIVISKKTLDKESCGVKERNKREEKIIKISSLTSYLQKKI